MEVVAAIVTAIGGIIGAAKSFLELRLTLVSLFKKEVQLNIAFSDLSKKDEKTLMDLYRAIELGKELTSRIYKHLLIKYLVGLLVGVILMVSVVVFIQSTTEFKTLTIFLLPLGAYFIIANILPTPLVVSRGDRHNELGCVFHQFTTISRQFGEEVNSKMYKLRRVFGFISGLTYTERIYLQHYLDLCSLRDTIEMFWIDRKIEEVKTFAFETIEFRVAFENTFTDIIEGLLKAKKDVQKNVDEIMNSIKSRGLERFLVLFQESFFEQDFQSYYHDYGRDGIKRLIRQYW